LVNYQVDPPTWEDIRIFDGIPNYVGEVINGMIVINLKKTNSFIDMFGNIVDMPVNSNGHPYYAEGYYRAAWDLRCGNLRLSEDGKTLYRRDADMSGKTRKLRTWHEIANLEGEYGIPSGRQRIRAWSQFIMNEADKNPPVYRGMRFNDYACLRTKNGVEVYKLDDNDDKAFIFCDMTAKTDEETVKWQFHTACQWTTWLTADEHSAQNLTRMFATPFLEPYKHLTYVLYGGGGNGKGILLGRMARQYPKYASAFNTKRFADGKGFTAEQESRKIIGKYWLFDEEADVLDQNSMTQIKRLSTGEAVVARKIGENAMTFQPKATLVIATNEPFVSAQAEASNRRFVFIRMKEGRSAKDFETFINWIDANGIVPFLYASCYTWAKCGDNPWNDVTIGGQYDMTDSEEWVRDCICRDGYAISKDNPYGKRFATTSRNKLGLRSTAKYVKKLGATIRVLEVNDEKRFQPYREAFENDMQDPGAMQDLVSRIAYTGFDGQCYDSDHKRIDAIYALKLSGYPITGAARAIANRAEIFDRYMLAYMRNMIVPERFIVGTEKDVQVEQRKQRERSSGDVTTIPVTDTKTGQVVPKYDFLPQWDNEKVSQYLEFTANEFVGETKVPPVDFPELGTLSQTTQSLVANREAFVSRILSFKAQVEAVFDSAGIPELSWQSTFPYTPQDIASIGDAAGKGVNADALRNYQGFLA